MKSRKDLLIDILKDKEANEEERIDAAHALEDFDDGLTLDALIAISSDKHEDVVLASICGESIGNIWSRNKHFDLKVYLSLQKAAQREIDAIILDRTFKVI